MFRSGSCDRDESHFPASEGGSRFCPMRFFAHSSSAAAPGIFLGAVYVRFTASKKLANQTTKKMLFRGFRYKYPRARRLTKIVQSMVATIFVWRYSVIIYRTTSRVFFISASDYLAGVVTKHHLRETKVKIRIHCRSKSRHSSREEIARIR